LMLGHQEIIDQIRALERARKLRNIAHVWQPSPSLPK
jgi:hypothetical protein